MARRLAPRPVGANSSNPGEAELAPETKLDTESSHRRRVKPHDVATLRRRTGTGSGEAEAEGLSKAGAARRRAAYRAMPDVALYGWEPQTDGPSAQICGFPLTVAQGTVCRAPAGNGTLHVGVGYCFQHRQVAAREQGTLLADIFRGAHIDPEDALEKQLEASQSAVSILTSLISEMPLQALESTAEGRVAMRLLREERDRLTKTAKAMIDLDFRERQTGLAEKLSAPIVAVLEGVLSDLRLDRAQQAAVGPIVRKHLALLEGGRLPAAQAPIDVEAEVVTDEDDGMGEGEADASAAG